MPCHNVDFSKAVFRQNGINEQSNVFFIIYHLGKKISWGSSDQPIHTDEPIHIIHNYICSINILFASQIL